MCRLKGFLSSVSVLKDTHNSLFLQSVSCSQSSSYSLSSVSFTPRTSILSFPVLSLQYVTVVHNNAAALFMSQERGLHMYLHTHAGLFPMWRVSESRWSLYTEMCWSPLTCFYLHIHLLSLKVHPCWAILHSLPHYRLLRSYETPSLFCLTHCYLKAKQTSLVPGQSADGFLTLWFRV